MSDRDSEGGVDLVAVLDRPAASEHHSAQLPARWLDLRAGRLHAFGVRPGIDLLRSRGELRTHGASTHVDQATARGAGPSGAHWRRGDQVRRQDQRRPRNLGRT